MWLLLQLIFYIMYILYTFRDEEIVFLSVVSRQYLFWRKSDYLQTSAPNLFLHKILQKHTEIFQKKKPHQTTKSPTNQKNPNQKK